MRGVGRREGSEGRRPTVLYRILPDPRLIVAAKDPVEVLHIHRPIPESVPIGHFDGDGHEIVDDVVDRDAYLAAIRDACARLGDRLEVRFYDHFEDVFDASVLDDLGGIRRLSVDGVPRIAHPEAIGRLPLLTGLRFGPRRIDSPGILGVLGVERLSEFTLAGSPEPAIDLSPLAGARSLRILRLLGHGRNGEAIGGAAGLTELALAPSARFPLAVLNRLASLEVLKLVLGNATTLADIRDLPALRDLSLREVRNLAELGDLQRFPRLRRLQVSDQPQIARILVGPRNGALEHLFLYSLPRLAALDGFAALPAARSLFAYDTRLDLPWTGLPPTLTHLHLVTRRVKGRAEREAETRAHGLVPAVHPAAEFFYK